MPLAEHCTHLRHREDMRELYGVIATSERERRDTLR